MNIYSTSKAREKLFKIVEDIEYEPVMIIGKKKNAVLISEDGYKTILETLHISLVPGLTQSIVEESKRPISESSEKIDWDNV